MLIPSDPAGRAGLHAAYYTALAAALAGGRAALDAYSRPLGTTNKGPRDLVTNGDYAAQEAVLVCLRAAFPDHAVLSEEGQFGETATGLRWIVDPVDGTTNYSRHLPFFSVSVALADGDDILVGAIYDPSRDEMFSALKGGGAYLNGRPIRAADSDDLSRAILSLGLSYDCDASVRIMEVGKHLIPHCSTVRNLGSAALSLAYIAAGRLDSYLHSYLYPWDAAAGMLILREAGGKVTDLDGGEWDFDTKGTLAAGPGIHGELLRLVREQHGLG